MRIRQSILIAGLEQTGKTYKVERLAETYAKSGRAVLAYNVGKISDFGNLIEIEVITPDVFEATLGKDDAKIFRKLPKIEYYKYKGKIYHFSKFREMFSGSGAKIYRIDSRYERYLYKCFFENVFDSLIIFDDNRASTRHGLPHELTELISRKNHCGHKHTKTAYGNDLAFIYHNLDTPPSELYDYLTRVMLFRLNRVPEKVIENPAFEEAIKYSVERLKNMPRFSYIEILLRETDSIKVIPFTYTN